MNNFYKRSGLSTAIMLLITSICLSQTNISGTVSDAESGDPIPGASILVKGTVLGTVSNVDGNFTVSPKTSLPLTLIISSVSYKPVEVLITAANTSGVSVKLEEDLTELGTVTVVGVKEEDILSAPVTVVRHGLSDIRQAATSEPYESLSTLKGVQMTYSSLNFPQINTRGFATIANTRFVQLIDGMDASAPLLNFPTGNRGLLPQSGGQTRLMEF
jgi:iron complex outermembrane recepter protein